jgi:hypothetical protein
MEFKNRRSDLVREPLGKGIAKDVNGKENPHRIDVFQGNPE